jgi:hypothetical protein
VEVPVGWRAESVDALATLDLGPSPVVLRRATAGDLPVIVALLAAGQLGATRDGVRTAGDLACYRWALPPSAPICTC